MSTNAAAPPLRWADRLRNLATVMVITIHVAAPIAAGRTDYDSSWWWWGNIYNSLSRASVPLFVMLSGFLLFSKDYPLVPFLKRRFTRVLIPALFWMLAYMIYASQVEGQPASLAVALRSLVEGPVYYHLWFIYLILGLYMTYPILKPWVQRASEVEFRYFFLLCILGTWVLKAMLTFLHFGIGLYIELFTNNAGYFVLGYYLGVKPFDAPTATGIRAWSVGPKRLVWLAVALIVAGTSITAIGSWWGCKTYGNTYFPYFYDYLTPGVGGAAIGCFLLARLTFNGPALTEFEAKFAESSFGIYFIHVFMMIWWSAAGFWHSRGPAISCVPIIVGIISLSSFLAIMFLRALPGGDKVT